MRFINWLLSFFGFGNPFPSDAELAATEPPPELSGCDFGEPEKGYPPTWLPPDVKTNGELRPHLPSRTNKKPRRYDEVQRDKKLQRKGAR